MGEQVAGVLASALVLVVGGVGYRRARLRVERQPWDAAAINAERQRLASLPRGLERGRAREYLRIQENRTYALRFERACFVLAALAVAMAIALMLA